MGQILIRRVTIHPARDSFVRNCNTALGKQILDVTKAEREPKIEPDRLVNDPGGIRYSDGGADEHVSET